MRRALVLLAGVALASPAAAQGLLQQAPFFTTPPDVVARMLRMAQTGPRDYVIDLGSGDGRIVIHAATAHGARGLGVDLDSSLVELARERAREAGVAARVEFRVQDVLQADLSEASVVTAYLVPYLLERLEPRLLAGLRPGARIVTHAFPLPNWPYDEMQSVRLEAPGPREPAQARLYLYVAPAQARGTWRAPGGWRLRVLQSFQKLDVEAWHRERPLEVRSARLSGERMEITGAEFAFSGRVARNEIRGELAGRGPLAFARDP